MKKLLISLILALILYCAYWFFVSKRVASEIVTRAHAYEELGYAISHAPVDMSGFPAHFNADLGPVRVTTPKGLKAELMNAQLSGKAYFPLSWSVLHSGVSLFEHSKPSGTSISVTVDTGIAKIDAQALAAGGGLKRLNIEARSLEMALTTGDPLPVKSLETLEYSFARAGQTAQLSATARGAALNAGPLGQLGRALGHEISLITGEGTIENFGAPTPRYLSDTLNVLWGPVDIGGGFDVTRGESGVLNGTINLTVANDTELLDELADKGILSNGEKMFASMIIGNLPQTDDGRRKVSISVKDSQMSIGSMTLGRLPF